MDSYFLLSFVKSSGQFFTGDILWDGLLGGVVGAVVGLTGAGGSLLSIPIFTYFFHMGLKEATLYSLVVEILACFTSFIFQFRLSRNKLGISLAFYSLFGSLLASPVKKFLPDFWILALYLGVCVYSIYQLWVKKKMKLLWFERRSQTSLAIMVGITLGILTTFTGLGGGVLIVPALLGFFALSQKDAVATSLLTIGLSAMASLGAQVFVGSSVHFSPSLIAMGFGIVLGSFFIEFMMHYMKHTMVVFLRRTVFSVVVIGSMTKMLL